MANLLEFVKDTADVIMLPFSTLIAGLAVVTSIGLFKKFWGSVTIKTARTISSTPRLDDKLAGLEKRVMDLSQIFEAAPEKLDAIRVENLHTKIEKVERDLDGLRKLLFEDPHKTIEIPLILKDIEGIKTSIASQDTKFEWISGYNKWLLGVMVTMAVALLTLAVSVILKQ